MTTTAEQIGNGAHKAGARADEALRHKASQLQKFFDDVEELLHSVSSSDNAEVKRLRDRVESSINQAKAAAGNGVRIAVDGTRRAAKATDDYVRQNPWTVIGAMAAVGLVAGALLRGGARK